MRRNILTYKAPPNNDGYDLICIHPDPNKITRQIRVQVKSRYASDCDRSFPVKASSFAAFDFLIAVFLNIGNFHRRIDRASNLDVPEIFTFPLSFIKHHHDATSSWEKVLLGKLNIEEYKNERGFELIARALKIDYPARPSCPS